VLLPEIKALLFIMAISQIGGATGTSSTTPVTTLSATYSPTPGNSVLLFLEIGAAATAISVKDNLGNSLTVGPTINAGAIHYFSYYTVSSPSGVTGYTATWTTSGVSSITLEEYSGNTGGINASLSGNTATANSGTASLTVNIDDANDWVVFGIGAGATLTGTVGNVRQSIGAGSNARQVLMDNTAATAGAAVTGTATLNPGNWIIIAIELRLTPVVANVPVIAITQEYTWGGGDGW
jgi:hypothetical protein